MARKTRDFYKVKIGEFQDSKFRKSGHGSAGPGHTEPLNATDESNARIICFAVILS